MKKKLVSVLLAVTLAGSAAMPVGASDFSVETEYAEISILQEETADTENPEENQDISPAENSGFIPEESQADAGTQTEEDPAEAAEAPEEAADPDESSTASEEDFDPAGSTDATDTDVEGNTEEAGKCGPYLNYSVSGTAMTITGTGETYRSGWYPAADKITSVTIKQGATEIGEEMFSGFTSLQTVSIPKSVTSIENSAFKNCSSLTGITIPDEAASLGQEIFSGCSKLTSAALPAALTRIPTGMFADCTSLTAFTFSEKINTIGSGAFAGCTALTGVTFPGNITTIEASAFRNCNSITSLTIPKTVTEIGEYAFDNCSSLKTVVFEEETEKIGAHTFTNIPDLTVTIPDSVESIADDAFESSGVVIVGYVGSFAEEYAGNEAHHYPFRNILAGKNTAEEGMCGDEAYYKVNSGVLTIGGSGSMFPYAWYPEADKADIVSIQIMKNSVDNIGQSAFQGFTALAEVNIPDTVTKIDKEAFLECNAMISVTIPESLEVIGSDAFNGCTSLTTVSFAGDSGLRVIHKNAFYGCTSLTSITLPDSLEDLGVHAFYGCSSLTKAILPDELTEIKTGTFYGTALKSIVLPEKLEMIGANAFSGTRLQSLTTPDAVQEIKDSAFTNCKALEKITLSDSVAMIGAYAFQGCTLLEDVTLSAALESVGVYAFAGCTSLKTITIPKSVKTIGDHAFAANTSENTTASNENTNLSNLVIQGYIGTAAETYANEKKLQFYALDVIKSLAAPEITVKNSTKGTCTTWNLVPGASQYYVYRKLSGGKYSRIATLKSYQSSYTDTTVTSNKVYLYAVRAIHDNVKSKYKEQKIRYLAMPVVSVSNTIEGATVTWKAITGASKYYIYRKTSDISYSRIGTVKKGVLTYTDSKAVSGTTYTYTVRAVNGSYLSAYKGVEKAYVAAPSLKVANGAKGPKLTWTEVDNCSRYAVYRKTGSGNYVRLITTDALAYQDTTAASGTTYTYGVAAIIGSANSGMAGVKDIYLSEITTKLKSVSSGVKVSWTSAKGAKKYVIYRKLGTGKYKKLTSVSSKTFSYTDKTVAKGNNYTYCVRAYRSGFYGPYVEAKISK